MPKKVAKKVAGKVAKKTTKKAAKKVVTPSAVRQQLFGHIKLIQVYSTSYYKGIHALMALRDTPGKTIAILTKDHRLQTVLETALATGKLVAAEVIRFAPGKNPLGSGWTVEDYSVDVVILYDL